MLLLYLVILVSQFCHTLTLKSFIQDLLETAIFPLHHATSHSYVQAQNTSSCPLLSLIFPKGYVLHHFLAVFIQLTSKFIARPYPVHSYLLLPLCSVI